MRCDQCKHWQPEDSDEWEAKGINFRKCGAVRERWVIQDEATDGKTWDDRDFDDDGDYMTLRRAALAKARAYVQDGSQYMADLMTGPDFGCVLFEQQ